MNYEELAKELMSVMEKDHRVTRNVQKGPIGGETFVLFLISKSGGTAIPSDISAYTGVSTARVAATLKSLERKGLIIREIDSEDRRKVQITITEAGKADVEMNYNMLLNRTIEMLSFLGEKDANDFIRIKKRLAERNAKLMEEKLNCSK